MARKSSHSKISMDVIRRIALIMTVVCPIVALASLFIPRLGILSFSTDNLRLYFISFCVLVGAIAVREALCENKTFMRWASDGFKKAANAVLIISIILIVVLPFVLGVVSVHGGLGWIVPLSFLAASVISGSIAILENPD